MGCPVCGYDWNKAPSRPDFKCPRCGIEAHEILRENNRYCDVLTGRAYFTAWCKAEHFARGSHIRAFDGCKALGGGIVVPQGTLPALTPTEVREMEELRMDRWKEVGDAVKKAAHRSVTLTPNKSWSPPAVKEEEPLNPFDPDAPKTEKE